MKKYDKSQWTFKSHLDEGLFEAVRMDWKAARAEFTQAQLKAVRPEDEKLAQDLADAMTVRLGYH